MKREQTREHELRPVSCCPGRETGFGRTWGRNEKGRDAVLVDGRDDRAEWLRREGGIEGRTAEVNKKKCSTRGRANNDEEMRRVVRKEEQIQRNCCLQPTHLFLKYPILHLIEYTNHHPPKTCCWG